MLNNFVAFILTHGRPDNVVTYKTLKKCGYTGRIVLIVDNEDKTIDEYYKNFGKDDVVVFDKKKYADAIDEGNNFDERRTITHARNACFDIARELGYTYFIELDDDYTAFSHIYDYNKDSMFKHIAISGMDEIIHIFLDYFASINCKAVAFLQGGDLIGGGMNTFLVSKHYPFKKRKAMNSFICSTERQFRFVGAMNEDVNTYTTLGSRGALFMTIPLIALNQKQTQSQSGGITDMYLKFGTLAKSFTTVMMMPSCVKASYQPQMGRIHHKISWKHTVPQIIREEYRKTALQSKYDIKIKAQE